MRTFGKVVGMLLTVLGFLGSLAIMANEVGLAGTMIAFLFAPLTAAVVPWYVLVRYGNPILLIVTYGGFVLYALADRESWKRSAA